MALYDLFRARELGGWDAYPCGRARGGCNARRLMSRIFLIFSTYISISVIPHTTMIIDPSLPTFVPDTLAPSDPRSEKLYRPMSGNPSVGWGRKGFSFLRLKKR